MDSKWGVVHRDETGRWGMRGPLVAVLFGSLFSVLGLGFLGVSAMSALTTEHFLNKSIAAQGKVTVLREVVDAQNHSKTFAPEFLFTARDGRSYSIQSHSSSNPPGFAVGETVRVLYDPADPNGAEIDSLWQLWWIPMIFGATGGICALTGVTLIVIGWIQKRREMQGWTMRSK